MEKGDPQLQFITLGLVTAVLKSLKHTLNSFTSDCRAQNAPQQ